jgi:hypothetical protein
MRAVDFAEYVQRDVDRPTADHVDADWIARWQQDLLTVGERTGIRLLDVPGWVAARGTDPSDRPDGLHLSGPALDDQARWIAGQLP